MTFKKQNLKNYLLHDTPVENLFISDYAKMAPGDYVKVYLLALMYANINENVSREDIAKSLNLSVGRVNDAFEYWKEQGIIKILSNGNDFEIEFVNIRDEAFGRSVNVNKTSQGIGSKLEDENLLKLLKGVEKTTGRLLERNEPIAIAEWIKNLEITPELILCAYKYCTEKKLSNRYKYVEAILKDWKEKGIKTLEDVKEYLVHNDKRYDEYRKIFKELGFLRAPSEPEKVMMDKWLDEDKFSLNEIFDACKKVTGIGNPNLNYINAVLTAKREETENQNSDVILEKHTSFDEYYERVRRENDIKTFERREAIFAKVPRLRELAEEIKDCGFKISKALLLGSSGNDALKAETEKQRVLSLEKATLLKSNGFGEKDLDQIYTCTKCKDTGLLDDGTKCDCYINR